MKTNDFLFPRRQTRRDFLKITGAAAAGLALPGFAAGKSVNPPVRMGSGYHTYELVEGWGALPEGMKYGFGCAIVADSRDRIFVTSRSANPCVAIFDRRGRLLETWSNDFAEKVGFTTDEVARTAHGLYWSKEGRREYLYFTENVAGPKEGPRIGARVYKTDLDGKILFQLGNVAQENSTSMKFDFTNPTDVAVAPNGDIYIVDGYGSQLVHRFDRDFKHLKTIGGRGKETGKFNICHGVWIKTAKRAEPEVYIADRANARIEVYSLELEYKRTLSGDHLRNPCCFYQHKDHIYVPDLGSRVIILDERDNPVALLGDGKGQPDNKTNPALFATPHALTVDSHGDFYLVEWVDFGRVRKFRHTPQKA